MKKKILAFLMIFTIIILNCSYISFSNSENLFWLYGIVNKDNPIDKDYVPTFLVRATVNRKYSIIRIDSRLIHDLNALFEEARRFNVELTLNSGYRSYNSQNGVFNHSLRYNGSAYTKKYVASPGHSEHQTGLAVDLSSSNKQWLMDNAHRFGFIHRYPKGKEDITGFEFENWHFRYIGDTFITTYMFEKGIVLEEIDTDETIFYYKKQNLDLSY